ncbi:MAG: SDR family oxidoreductase [Actinobacteria bacterium]|nr:SDR family oxidoreductase [Actinomycetota bacterium]
MAIDWTGTVAVITGGGSGIGRACAHSFAARGAMVVVTDVDAARASTVADELGDAAVGLRVDVTEQAELEAARDLALDHFGRIDLVMNNVGVIVMGGVEEIPLDAWQRAIDINLLGLVRSNLVFLPHLIAQGSGYVVNTASTLGLLPYSYDRTPYMATKHAIVGLSEGMYLALGPKGIQVSCLCPAGVLTNIVEQITVHGTIAPPRAPTLKLSQPEEVGELVADGVEDGRFLILTAPEAADELAAHGADMDGYLARMARELEEELGGG